MNEIVGRFMLNIFCFQVLQLLHHWEKENMLREKVNFYPEDLACRFWFLYQLDERQEPYRGYHNHLFRLLDQ